MHKLLKVIIPLLIIISMQLYTTADVSAKTINTDSNTHDNNLLGNYLNNGVQIPSITNSTNYFDGVLGLADNTGQLVTPQIAPTTLSNKGSDFGTATDENTYSFISNKTIQNKKGTSKMWDIVLSAKETEVAQEIELAKKGNFKNNIASGDLDLSNGDTLWGNTQLRSMLDERGETVLIRITVDGDDAYLLVDNKSGTQLEWTLAGIESYKDAVKNGVFTGGMSAGFNVYAMFSKYNVLLSEILTNTDGTGEIKTNANLVYSADVFFHPIVGKLNRTDFKGKTVNYNNVEDKITKIQITHTAKDKVSYVVNSEYRIFNDPATLDRGFFTDAKTTKASIQNGLVDYVSKYNKNKKRPLNGIVDTTMYMIVPHEYEYVQASTSYQLMDSGYKVVPKVRVLAHKNEVYEQVGEELVLKGKFSDYGLNPKEMMVYKTTEDGVSVSAVIPLRYKEVIYSTEEGKSYYSGRTVLFNSDFKKKLTLDKENKDIFGVDGMLFEGEKARHFAFPEGADYKNVTSHADVGEKPSVFTLQADYIPPSGGKELFGAVIVRNNTYAKDNRLLEWLDTPKAQSMEGVDAETLKKLILGEMTVEKEGITYEEWLRLQEIKAEMEGTIETKVKELLFKILMFGGFLIIIYSILFSMFYFVDTMTFFTDISLMHIMTFGRCYPVVSEEDVRASGYSDVRYIGLKIALFTTFCGCFVGALFMTVEPIVNLVTWFYMEVTDLTTKIG